MEDLRAPRWRIRTVVLTFLMTLGGLAMAPVWAHDTVVGGSPADGATVEQSPTEIVLEFSAEPKEGFNTMAITNPDGEVVYRGEPSVEGRNLLLDLPEEIVLEPGDYTIGFQITSSDGHATRGKTSFSIAGSAANSPTLGAETQSATTVPPMGEGESSLSITSPSSWAKVGVVAGVLVVLTVLAVFVVRRRTGSR